MKNNLCVRLVSLITLFLLAACGSGGGSEGTPETANLSIAVDNNSYLPLTSGIVTKFSDGHVRNYMSLNPSKTLSVENVVLKVLDGGVVNIIGRKINSETGVTRDIDEKLTFKDDNGQILLTQYSLDYTESDGKTFHNDRIYNPPVIFLQDKTSISTTQPFYTTNDLTVQYDGQPEDVMITSAIGTQKFDVTGYENISVNINYIGPTQSVSIDNDNVEYFLGMFDYGFPPNYEIWFPVNGFVIGQFLIAKGFGIVGIAGQDVVETNVTLQ
jgi:hypothetical protein